MNKVIGRIDFLHTDGRVRESSEYTSEYMFKMDIREEVYFGVPLIVYIYADKDGKTISIDFLKSIEILPCNVKVVPNPYLETEVNE